IYAHDKSTFREITEYAKVELARQYGGAGKSVYYWETYHEFGDPSIQLRTAATRAAVIEGATEVPVGVSPLDYVVKDEHGTAIANARVSFLAKDGTVMATAISAANSAVSFSPP